MEMTHTLALNTRLTREQTRAFITECPLQDYDALTRKPRLEQLAARINSTTDEEEQRRMKSWLPFRCPHYTKFRDDYRDREHIVAESFTWQTCIDIDDPELVEKANEMSERLDIEAGGQWQGMMLHKDYSIRRKLHIDIRLPMGMTVPEAQRAYCKALGVECDTSCFTPERFIYISPASYEIYRADGWYQQLSEEEIAQRRKAYTDRGLTIDGRTEDGCYYDPEGDAGKDRSAAGLTATVGEGQVSNTAPTDFKGIAYQDIIAEWFRRTGGEPQQGERNDRLHRLASHLRYITDNNEQTLLAVMPRYGLSEDEMRGLIHSACQGRFYSMPKLLQEVVRSLTPKVDAADTETGLGAVPPEMPKRLPPLIKLLLQNTPDIYRPAVAHAVFPSLGAHLHKTRFRYIDNVEHEATLMNCLMAGTGAGKDCISEPINRIMADIRRRDAENLEREKAWKKQVNSKGANKDKAERPEGLIIQEIDTDVTNAAFVQRMAEADEHFLYVKMNEIEQFDALKGNGRGNHQFQIMCLSFDPGNRYGQTRVGTQSVTEKVCIRFNWNAATTVKKGQRYFQNVLTDGPISRINFCTIPRREIGADMPVYGTYDATFDEQLRPYIERLTSARGTIDCPQAFRLAQKLKNECAEFARLSQSETYWNLSFRANVIAYLKACVLFVAHGYTWTKEMEQFIRWSLKYDLWCKMQFFGEAIEQAEQGGSQSNRRGPRNLLELLPNEFTFDDAVAIRRQQGLSREGTQDMIRVWRNRGYIEARTTDDDRTNSSNSFDKPNEQNGACTDSAMARNCRLEANIYSKLKYRN